MSEGNTPSCVVDSVSTLLVSSVWSLKDQTVTTWLQQLRTPPESHFVGFFHNSCFKYQRPYHMTLWLFISQTATPVATVNWYPVWSSW